MIRKEHGAPRRVPARRLWVAAAALIALSLVPAWTDSAWGGGPRPETIRLPPGFRIAVFADDVPGARSMTLGDRGTLFVGTRGEGKVYAIPTRPGEAKAGKVITIASGPTTRPAPSTGSVTAGSETIRPPAGGRIMKAAALFALALVFSASARAEVKTEIVEYKQGSTVLEGYLAYDDAIRGKRPGVLVIHEWWGINDYTRSRTEQVARLGYVAFAPDIYGKGKRARNADEARALAGALREDRALMRARAAAGLDVLRKNARTDAARIAAIGYCFGGTAALELARSGADVAGAVTFHGGLDTPSPGDAKNIKARVLVLTGADDQSVPPAQVQAFGDEMRHGGVDWQLVEYGGAVHGFTNPAGGNDNSKGYAYNENADRRSWEAMKVFFAEIFK